MASFKSIRVRSRCAARSGRAPPSRSSCRSSGICPVSDSVRILVIDDGESIRDSMSQVLLKEGYRITTAASGQEGLELFGAEAFQVVFVDLKLPGTTGLQVLSRIKEAGPETPVIIITGYASIESAVEAMKRGAFDYMTKPFTPEELRVITKRALDGRKLLFENIYLRSELEAQTEFDTIVGKSQAMRGV